MSGGRIYNETTAPSYLLQSMESKFDRNCSLKQLRGTSPFPFWLPVEDAEAAVAGADALGSLFVEALFFSSAMVVIS